MKNFLVTGGAGFIGSNYINYMFEKHGKNINIINLDKLTYAGNLNNLKNVNSFNYTLVKGDICDKNVVKNIFEKYDIDCVVHFAAESHVDRSIETPEIFIQTNVLGTLNLLNIAKKYWEISEGLYKENTKFVHISTDEVYGSLGATGFFTEESPIQPRSPYSASKASSDLLVLSYFETYNMPINITRCSNNYGPFHFPEKLIPLMINNALKGEKLPVYGDGKNVRDWLFVKDHVKAIEKVTDNGKLGEVYNIGGHNEKYNIDIVNIIIDSLQKLLPTDDKRLNHINKNLISYVKDRKGHDLRYAIDPTKIKKELDWQPETTFDVGIIETIKWYLANEKWIEDIFNGNYQNYNSEVK